MTSIGTIKTVVHDWHFFNKEYVLVEEMKAVIWEQYEETVAETPKKIPCWIEHFISEDTLVSSNFDELVSLEAFDDAFHFNYLSDEKDIDHYYDTYTKVGPAIDRDLLLFVDQMQLFIIDEQDRMCHKPLLTVW